MRNTVLTICLIISLVANGFLLFILLSDNNDAESPDSENTQSIYGIYQASYNNNYDHQVVETVKIYENGVCKYEYAGADYTGKNEQDCKWKKSGNHITLTIGDKNTITKEAEILNSGNLLMENTQLVKL